MKEISEHIELKFYEVLKHKISIQDFEKWVYETKELELELLEDIYTDLISLNYKTKYNALAQYRIESSLLSITLD
ncbi:hypothetical protein [Flammeovirga kamogawensis]|uniref:Uncharacterized protein n=1 Tax=Flammeovirga kamogawensis TaxID=373891 RepID=A0ABX8H5B6_9BACT|nr:hypothetical protein [Flammeovirga kamogawensis]MBB6461848.1 hypothetical protein [Flammeovirga kamogawensis]QWG10537.1 hypothetical protein KM029_26555 [Flammeovirga kamogawensis]TRX63646.1 hypothetical protein EO216_24830 [Flammeovirga kamogawensis]